MGAKWPGDEPHSSIWMGGWKAIYLRWQQYTLAADIGEAKNLASANPERLKRLAPRMQAEHMQYIGGDGPPLPGLVPIRGSPLAVSVELGAELLLYSAGI
jgi:hypothetical protein